MKQAIITGGSGLVGQFLLPTLCQMKSTFFVWDEKSLSPVAGKLFGKPECDTFI